MPRMRRLPRHFMRRKADGPIEVVVSIPASARSAFGGRTQVWFSTGTRDEHEAIAIGSQRVAEIKATIAKTRAATGAVVKTAEPVRPLPRKAIHPDRAFAALERWRNAEVEAIYIAGFNGELTPFRMDDEGFGQAKLLAQLYRSPNEIVELAAKLVEALNGQGVECDADHPALKNATLRAEFAKRWAEVEEYRRDFRGVIDRKPGREKPPIKLQDGVPPPESAYDRWRREKTVEQPPPLPATFAAAPSTAGEPRKLIDLFERWVDSRNIQNTSRRRGYVTRLSEFLGNPNVSNIDSDRLDRFKVLLRRFPNSKRDFTGISFVDVIDDFSRDGAEYKTLADKTIWNWFQTYNAMFAYGVGIGWLQRNPLVDLMPVFDRHTVPPLIYDADDIAAIFNTPLFNGCDRAHSKSGKAYGYRTTPGSLIIKDAYYWLPLVCLWSGCRMEEPGAARAADIKIEGGIYYLDLTSRNDLKNEQSKRKVPLHRKLTDLGFLNYVSELDRESYLFPELPHDPTDAKSSTRMFSKWWGHWCKANAEKASEGFDHPRKKFHSFRHAFKEKCRGIIPEDVHDRLTGHRGNHHVGREYGGMPLGILRDNIEKIDFPTFPELP